MKYDGMPPPDNVEVIASLCFVVLIAVGAGLAVWSMAQA